jgi:hypothetical protein
MNTSKFKERLSRVYRHILFEQDIPTPQQDQLAPPAPPTDAAAAMMMPPPVPSGEEASKFEKPSDKLSPLSQEEEAFLSNMLAKAIFLDVPDEEKNNLVNLQKNLNDENSDMIENEVVKIINSENYQMLDVDENLFEVSPKNSRELIESLKKIIGNEELKQGKGRVYIVNLLVTALLRDFSKFEKSRTIKLLKNMQSKDESVKLEETDSKTVNLLINTLKKYAK